MALLCGHLALLWHGLRTGRRLHPVLSTSRHLERLGYETKLLAILGPLLIMRWPGPLDLAYFAADCPAECYPEGLIANRALEVLDWHVNNPETPFFFGCMLLPKQLCNTQAHTCL